MDETTQNENENEINQGQNQDQEKVNELLIELSNSSSDDNDELIRSILRLLSNNSRTFRNTTFNRIRENSPLSINEIRDMYDEEHPPPEVESSTTGTSVITTPWIVRLRARHPDNEYLEYDYNIIEMSNDKMFLLTYNKDDPNAPFKKIIADFSLKLLSKTIDYKRNNLTYYTFEANKNSFYNYTVENFLKTWSDKIYIVNSKYALIKYIFSDLSKNIPEKKAKYTLGFKNGWYLPFIKDTNYSIMWDTEEQREVLKRCEKIYIKYSQEEKIDIINMYKELIKITDMPKEYITIIISWCIIAPFKLYFIKELGLFPILILAGVRTTGKTSFLDVLITNFYRDYKAYCSGDEAHSPSRFGDSLTSSTFPRVINDWEKVKEKAVNIIKESATGVSNFKRKRADQTYVTNKPKVSPLAITSQDLGNKFSDPANLSRAIILDYDKSIKRNPRWAELNIKLKKEKPFSFLYDLTKDWKNKDLDDLMERVNKTIKIDEIIKKIEKASRGMLNIDKHYPRVREIYRITVAGAYLFKEVFRIKLPLKNVFETLIQSRRNVTDEYLTQLIAFCNMAKDYDPTNHQKYITCELYWDIGKGEFYFRTSNKRDYHEFTHTKIGIRPMTEKAVEALTDKSLIKYKKVTIESGRAEWVCAIKEELLNI